MSLILSIETGTNISSIALARDGELLALRESDKAHQHASQIGVFVDELLKENNITPEELQAVAVSKGPGSYTGLRIGVSFAKGLCYALNIPLIAVGSLRSLAEVAREDYEAGIIVGIEDWTTAKLCPMIDARRMEVYTQVFDTQGQELTQVVAEIVTEESFGDFIGGNEFLIFGDGASKCTEVLPSKWRVKLINITPSARGLVKLAQQALDQKQTEDVAYFEPFYLKNFVAKESTKKFF